MTDFVPRSGAIVLSASVAVSLAVFELRSELIAVDAELEGHRIDTLQVVLPPQK